MTATKLAKKAKTKAKKSTKKKLTLSLDQDVIEQGKAFARDQGVSLSRLVEQYLREQMEGFIAYIPVKVIEPDAELGRLFPPRPQFSYSNTSLYEMRDDYYSSILNREKVEEE